MGSLKQDYPDYLNPFDSDGGGEDADDTKGEAINSNKQTEEGAEEYPDYLSPFGDEEDTTKRCDESKPDDYDDSLNPFEEEGDIDPPIEHDGVSVNTTATATQNPNEPASIDVLPTLEETLGGKPPVPLKKPTGVVAATPDQPDESLGPPPVPLPRTRSLLKKELALRNKQPPKQQTATQLDNHQTSSSISESESTSTTTTTTTITTNGSTIANNEGSLQQKKTKRNAPPLPVNYKRQVSGSAEAIEEELNQIGDRLAELEIDSQSCQSDLKQSYQVNDTEFAIARAKFVEIIRIKNSILRRQKELMYRKREITLDQNHSDIEYELRMIGNKQSSNKTPEDDAREKELLKKLVEIVEEKNDIVENLNRDTSCDIEDVEEALRRMNLTSNGSQPKPDSKEETSSLDVPNKQKVAVDSCYKSNNLVSGAKFSKIATLLPKSGTLKGTIKLKRKRLFKKSSQVP